MVEILQNLSNGNIRIIFFFVNFMLPASHAPASYFTSFLPPLLPYLHALALHVPASKSPSSQDPVTHDPPLHAPAFDIL